MTRTLVLSFGAVIGFPVSMGAGETPATTQRSGTTVQVVPFTIDVPETTLTDLKNRLGKARFPEETSGGTWNDGARLAYVQELVTYWKDQFDWRVQERRLNQFDQFKTEIDGLDIHFIHERSPDPDALPLLLLNGWPSSIDEFSQVIKPLTDPSAFGGSSEQAFHVIMPAMPGYGFSDKPRETGFGPERMSMLWVTLMDRLGYTQYGVHGTDWGISVGTWLALKDTDRVAGLHLTGCIGSVRPTPVAATPTPRMPSDTSGYIEIQSTKPQTLGYSLSDSPVGLAAWIVEKFHGWSDHRGRIEEVYTKDELLTNIMIYWVTNSGPSSTRLYYESRHPQGRFLGSFFEGFLPSLPAGYVDVPTGCAGFSARYDSRGRSGRAPRSSAETRYNVVHWAEMPRGGHFPALEEPEMWLQDIRAFFKVGR